MRISIYVDGFNLYFRMLRPHGGKWLDVWRFCEAHLREGESVSALKFFTARTKPDPFDRGKHVRQQHYLQALAAHTQSEVIFGQFRQNRKRFMVASEYDRGVKSWTDEAIVWEEKGSDVNIAAHLLVDAAKDRFDKAIVLSNDSDLAEPIRLVRAEFGKPVGLFCPVKSAVAELQQVSTFIVRLKHQRLLGCQLPNPVHNNGHEIHMPTEWL